MKNRMTGKQLQDLQQVTKAINGYNYIKEEYTGEESFERKMQEAEGKVYDAIRLIEDKKIKGALLEQWDEANREDELDNFIFHLYLTLISDKRIYREL